MKMPMPKLSCIVLRCPFSQWLLEAYTAIGAGISRSDGVGPEAPTLLRWAVDIRPLQSGGADVRETFGLWLFWVGEDLGKELLACVVSDFR